MSNHRKRLRWDVVAVLLPCPIVYGLLLFGILRAAEGLHHG